MFANVPDTLISSKIQSTSSTAGRVDKKHEEKKSYQVQRQSSCENLVTKVTSRKNPEEYVTTRKETVQSFPQNPRPWSECEHLIKRSKKLRVKEEKCVTLADLSLLPQSPRPLSEYDDLSRRKQMRVQKELQRVNPKEMPRTDYECIYKLCSMVEQDQRESFITYHFPAILKSEKPVETEKKETRDTGFSKLPKLSTSFTWLSNKPRRYENKSWGRRGHTQSLKQPIGLHIPTETEKLSTIFCGKCEPKPMLGKSSEAAPKSSIHFLYFKMKHFPRFHYVYNLIRDCKSRIEKCRKVEVESDEMFKNVIIEIVIVGSFTEDDLHLLTKSAEKKRMLKGKHIWKVQPLVCFEDDCFSKSNIKRSELDRETSYHKILIKSNTFCDKRDKTDDSIIIVERNKEQIKEKITSCLEEPLHIMLQEWLKDLKTVGSSRLASGFIAEIEAIQKQMEPCNIHVLRSAGASTIVPDNIIDLMFRRPEVHSFGIWWNSSFKVFVNKTDEKRLRDDLTKMNPTFFTKYNIEIETGKLEDNLLHLMQGDEIQAKIPNKQKIHTGTLGGIVTKADDKNKKYALTCHHLFPEVGERAYTAKCEDIGACFYTTREKSCDFAAIEIEKSFSEKCDETFQNEDKKITNARVFSESLTNVGIVHKTGATTKVTKGRVLSSEYYDKILDDKNRGHVFLVKGIPGNFSEKGDSGSLVFTRSKDAQQTCVDVLGMVYSNKVTVYDDNDDDDEQESKNEDNNEGDNAASNVKEGENISSCYRINIALELFKQNKGEEVKFKNDLLLSSPEMSSESDDSNEDTPQ